MSATNRGAVRVQDDHYATPIPHAMALFPLLPRGVPILDPCCGEGNILVAARASGHTELWGVEINPELSAVAIERGFAVATADALTCDWPEASVIAMNTPFSRGDAFIRKAIAHVRPHGGIVAALMRVDWTVPAKRNPLFEEVGVPDINTLDRRPAFCMSVKCKSRQVNIETGKVCEWRATFPMGTIRPSRCPNCKSEDISIVTTDAAEYAWMIWSTAAGPQAEGAFRRLNVNLPPRVKKQKPPPVPKAPRKRKAPDTAPMVTV